MKSPEQLAEVAEAAVRLDGVRQMVMTTGTAATPDRGARHLARCAAAVRAVLPDLPIQVQCEPPDDLAVLAELHAAGATAIGIHVESLDDDVRRRWTPGKATVPLADYWAAWREAVRVFGRNRVSTYLLVGLGEDPDELVAGAAELIAAGVYPFVVPFRPLAGTLAAADGAVPPDPGPAGRRDPAGGRRCCAAPGMRGADQGAGCAACGACSALASGGRVSDGTHDHDGRACCPGGRGGPAGTSAGRRLRPGPAGSSSTRPTRTGVAAHRALRRRVFVDEQGAVRRSTTPTTSTPTRRRSSSSPGRPAGHGGRRGPPGARPRRRRWRRRPRLVDRQPAGGRARRPAGHRLGAGAGGVRPGRGRGRAAVRRRRPGRQAGVLLPARLAGGGPVPRCTGTRTSACAGRSTRWRARPPPSGRSADVLGDLRPGGPGFVGDDGAPVPGTDVVVVTDAILPTMVERDPWWAGWCAVLVNVNDLAAMGAAPVGLTDALAAPDAVARPPRRRRHDGGGRALRRAGPRRPHAARRARPPCR